MYIWRGKNRRDRREYLLSGLALWGAPKDTANRNADDEIIRHDLEQKHIQTFQQRTRVTIFRYLNTKQGQLEINHIVDEIDRLNQEAAKAARLEAGQSLFGENGNEIVIEAVPEEMKKKANIYEIFRKFDEDGSDSIDRNEMRVLLDELKVPVTDDELAELIKKLDGDGGGEIEFEEFYNWFVMEADAQRSKNKLVGIKNFLKDTAARMGTMLGLVGSAKDGEESSIYKGFKRMVCYTLTLPKYKLSSLKTDCMALH